MDVSGTLVGGTADDDELVFPPQCPDPARPLASPALITDAMALLQSAKAPLVVVGKGAAYARAEAETLQFLNATQLPFLATPMGKGTVPDDHPLSVAAARSTALGGADTVLLVGARLNWM